jgi:hypothetical protein
MAKYTTRTCHSCGIRKPQPEMHKETVYVESGRSRSGVSGATGIGLFLGDKKSTDAVNRWLFNSGQRTYQRKKEVWVCSKCGGRGVDGLASTVGSIIVLVGLVFVISLIASAIGGK